MKRRHGFVFFAAAMAAAAAIAYVSYQAYRPPGTGPARPGAVDAGHEITSRVHLYFSDREGEFLTAEARVVTHTPGPAPLGRAIVAALLAGPRTDRVPTLPEEVRLLAFYLAEDGTAYVDLSEAASAKHPGGAQAELMSVFSVVNSLILNIPEINRVKILLAGREVSSLAGHIDLRQPLAANMLIVR